MSEEWSDWFPHDDSGMPQGITGSTIVQCRLWDGELSPMRGDEVDWHCPDDPIIRYRIRKPRALLELIDMVEHLPEREDA